MSEKITSVSTPFDYSPVITGALTVALDKYLLEEPNMTNSLYLCWSNDRSCYSSWYS